jgi:hypothetical protein
MRGSKLVAAIVPVSAEDLELGPRLSDPQAERFWRHLEAERRDGASLVMDSAEGAVAAMSGASSPGPPRRRALRGRKRRR